MTPHRTLLATRRSTLRTDEGVATDERRFAEAMRLDKRCESGKPAAWVIQLAGVPQLTRGRRRGSTSLCRFRFGSVAASVLCVDSHLSSITTLWGPSPTARAAIPADRGS